MQGKCQKRDPIHAVGAARYCQNGTFGVKDLTTRHPEPYIEKMVHEVCFDGLVGPTHNFSGLSTGNLASMRHGQNASNPRQAALEGLKKIQLLRQLGIRQAVIPPQERPNLYELRRIGFTGSDTEILQKAARVAPQWLSSFSSASSMWTANAATVAPSSDTADGKTHFTPSNLVSKLHRCIEPPATARALRAIFRSNAFVHHDSLPAHEFFGDEGAANHTRLAAQHGAAGLHLFVYGRSLDPSEKKPQRFVARQSREASESIARLHKLNPSHCVFAQQNPEAIDAGVFHNDVICVGNESTLFFHERCFARPNETLAEIKQKWSSLHSTPLKIIEVREAEVPLADAVQSYLFNSELVTLPQGKIALIAPAECQQVPTVQTYLQRFQNQTDALIYYPDIRQSMQNGGGPACLRLRVVLNEEEIKACAPGVFIDNEKQSSLENWVRKHYRDRLLPADLADPQLLLESRAALDELTQILGLGTLYPFQG